MEDGFEACDDISMLKLSSSDQVFLVQFPADFDVTKLKGIKLHLDQDEEDRVVTLKDDSQQTIRIQREALSEMDNIYRPLKQDVLADEIVLGPSFDGVITITDVLSAVKPLSVDKVHTLQIDHAYSTIPQKTGLRVHAAPIGSLSSVKQINQRNKRKAEEPSTSSVAQPQSEKKKKHEVITIDEAHDDHKDKKEKKEKKEKKKKDNK